MGARGPRAPRAPGRRGPAWAARGLAAVSLLLLLQLSLVDTANGQRRTTYQSRRTALLAADDAPSGGDDSEVTAAVAELEMRRFVPRASHSRSASSTPSPPDPPSPGAARGYRRGRVQAESVEDPDQAAPAAPTQSRSRGRASPSSSPPAAPAPRRRPEPPAPQVSRGRGDGEDGLGGRKLSVDRAETPAAPSAASAPTFRRRANGGSRDGRSREDVTAAPAVPAAVQQAATPSEGRESRQRERTGRSRYRSQLSSPAQSEDVADRPSSATLPRRGVGVADLRHYKATPLELATALHNVPVLEKTELSRGVHRFRPQSRDASSQGSIENGSTLPSGDVSESDNYPPEFKEKLSNNPATKLTRLPNFPSRNRAQNPPQSSYNNEPKITTKLRPALSSSSRLSAGNQQGPAARPAVGDEDELDPLQDHHGDGSPVPAARGARPRPPRPGTGGHRFSSLSRRHPEAATPPPPLPLSAEEAPEAVTTVRTAATHHRFRPITSPTVPPPPTTPFVRSFVPRNKATRSPPAEDEGATSASPLSSLSRSRGKYAPYARRPIGPAARPAATPRPLDDAVTEAAPVRRQRPDLELDQAKRDRYKATALAAKSRLKLVRPTAPRPAATKNPDEDDSVNEALEDAPGTGPATSPPSLSLISAAPQDSAEQSVATDAAPSSEEPSTTAAPSLASSRVPLVGRARPAYVPLRRPSTRAPATATSVGASATSSTPTRASATTSSRFSARFTASRGTRRGLSTAASQRTETVVTGPDSPPPTSPTRLFPVTVLPRHRFSSRFKDTNYILAAVALPPAPLGRMDEGDEDDEDSTEETTATTNPLAMDGPDSLDSTTMASPAMGRALAGFTGGEMVLSPSTTEMSPDGRESTLQPANASTSTSEVTSSTAKASSTMTEAPSSVTLATSTNVPASSSPSTASDTTAAPSSSSPSALPSTEAPSSTTPSTSSETPSSTLVSTVSSTAASTTTKKPVTAATTKKPSPARPTTKKPPATTRKPTPKTKATTKKPPTATTKKLPSTTTSTTTTTTTTTTSTTSLPVSETTTEIMFFTNAPVTEIMERNLVRELEATPESTTPTVANATISTMDASSSVATTVSAAPSSSTTMLATTVIMEASSEATASSAPPSSTTQATTGMTKAASEKAANVTSVTVDGTNSDGTATSPASASSSTTQATTTAKPSTTTTKRPSTTKKPKPATTKKPSTTRRPSTKKPKPTTKKPTPSTTKKPSPSSTMPPSTTSSSTPRPTTPQMMTFDDMAVMVATDAPVNELIARARLQDLNSETSSTTPSNFTTTSSPSATSDTASSTTAASTSGTTSDTASSTTSASTSSTTSTSPSSTTSTTPSSTTSSTTSTSTSTTPSSTPPTSDRTVPSTTSSTSSPRPMTTRKPAPTTRRPQMTTKKPGKATTQRPTQRGNIKKPAATTKKPTPTTTTTLSTTTAASTTLSTSPMTPEESVSTTARAVFFKPVASANDNAIPRGRALDLETTTRLSSSTASEEAAKDKDWVVFGIYPNNTVVRKNPNTEDVFASPFVIFGIYPNNTIVRKFPNGTVIPEGIAQANEVSRDEIAEFQELGLLRASTATISAAPSATPPTVATTTPRPSEDQNSVFGMTDDAMTTEILPAAPVPRGRSLVIEMERQAAVQVSMGRRPSHGGESLASRIVQIALERALTSTAMPNDDSSTSSSTTATSSSSTTTGTTARTTTSRAPTTTARSTTVRGTSTRSATPRAASPRAITPSRTTVRSTTPTTTAATKTTSTSTTTATSTSTTMRPEMKDGPSDGPLDIPLGVPALDSMAATGSTSKPGGKISLWVVPRGEGENADEADDGQGPLTDSKLLRALVAIGQDQDAQTKAEGYQTTTQTDESVFSESEDSTDGPPSASPNPAADAALLNALLGAGGGHGLGGPFGGRPVSSTEQTIRDQLLITELIRANQQQPPPPRSRARPSSTTTTSTTTVPSAADAETADSTTSEAPVTKRQRKRPASSTPRPTDFRGLFGSYQDSPRASAGDAVNSRDQPLVSAAINVTRAVSQFMGLVIQGIGRAFKPLFSSGPYPGDSRETGTGSGLAHLVNALGASSG